jgi:hypothetical protein
MNYAMGLAMLGAIAIALLPKNGVEDRAEQRVAVGTSSA